MLKKPINSSANNNKVRALDVVLTTVGILLLAISSIGVISKFISKDKLLFGFRSDIVLTSSMASINEELKEEYIDNGWTNQLKVHDWIFTTKVDEKDLQVGDIVTYVNPISGITTHRIVSIREINEINYFTIRGDAVEEKNIDGEFTYNSIVGKVTHNAGQFGQVIYFLQSVYGVILMVGLALICFGYSFFSDRLKDKEKIINNEK